MNAPNVRPPAVAGTFYPGDPAELAALVDALLEDARARAAPSEGDRRAARGLRVLGTDRGDRVCGDPASP
jgi:predicted class III extradiol MEMO1 family dioxygenase